MPFLTDVAADATQIVTEMGQDVTYIPNGGNASTIQGVWTEKALEAERPGAQALGLGTRGQARRGILEVRVAQTPAPAQGDKFTIGGITYQVEAVKQRTWLVEFHLVSVEAV